MDRWIWFALGEERRLDHGDQAADDCGVVHAVLRGRGLTPLLVVPRSRWELDLSGGPVGEPVPLRSATELAMLRAEGELELPAMRSETAARPHPRRTEKPRGWGLRRGHRGAAPPPPTFEVHARAWSPTLVSVAIRTAAGEVFEGTERLFATGDEGLAAAAEWKGQLEFVCEQWVLDGATVDPGQASVEGPDDDDDPHAAARLLGH